MKYPTIYFNMKAYSCFIIYSFEKFIFAASSVVGLKNVHIIPYKLLVLKIYSFLKSKLYFICGINFNGIKTAKVLKNNIYIVILYQIQKHNLYIISRGTGNNARRL